jgi:hypothetical protein
MAKIARRGREYVGVEVDPETNTTTATWRIWYETDSGRTRSTYVGLDRKTELSENSTDDERREYGERVNRENQKTLDKAQDRFEKNDPFELPLRERDWNPEKEHIGGAKCWCGTIHPPHYPFQSSGDAPTCWCGKKHQGQSGGVAR